MSGIPHSGGVGMVLMLALGEAALCGADEIEPVHVLLGLCKACEMASDGPGLDLPHGVRGDVAELQAEVDGLRAAFERAGLDTGTFRHRLRAQVRRTDRTLEPGRVPSRGAAVRRLLSWAEDRAAAEYGELVGLRHLLPAVLETPDPPWAELAADLGAADLRRALVYDGPEQAGAPAAGGATVSFTVLHGPLQGETFTYTERTTCVVGRADDCTLRLPADPAYAGISRYHCLLDINPPDVRVRDLGSFNGTYVNGEKIGQRDAQQPPPGPNGLLSSERELRHGDEIGLGGVRLLVGVHVPVRCAGCGKVVPEAEEPDAATQPGAYHCHLCRTTQEPSAPRPLTGTGAARLCVVCGGRLGTGHVVHPAEDELCAACKGDPERVMRLIAQVGEDGSRTLRLFGGYTVLRLLGQGGMGAVYLARDHQTEELCALKVMLPQAAGSETATARFLREMSTIELLRHPHLVRLQDHGSWHGIFFFVMDYCDGGDVAGLVQRRGGRLPPYQAVGITLQVLDGLSYAHQADARAYDREGRPIAARGLVHRDLSPRNIFLHQGVAKVGDFGLAKAFDAAGRSGLTRTGTSAGSPSFVSRQQVLQFKRAQPEVDVWAAAACLYYMLTGSAPRDFPPHLDRWRVVLDSPAVPVRRRNPEVPEHLAKVLDHALTEQPAIGFSTAAEFRQALLEVRV